MIDDREIRPLLAYRGSSVLSVYLNIDPSNPANQGTRRAYQIWLESALREAESEIDLS